MDKTPPQTANNAASAESATPATGYCGYWMQGTTLECRGDGHLWDADDDGYDPDDTSMPCPACNTQQYLENAKEEAEGVLEGSTWAGYYTGVSLWEGAVRTARAANPDAAEAALKVIGRVDALLPDKDAEEGYVVRSFCYGDQAVELKTTSA